MRLIDANALHDTILRDEKLDGKDVNWAVNRIISHILNTPTIEYPFYQEAYQTGYEEGKNDRPKGKWRSVGFEKGYAFCICSECGNTTRLYRDSKNEFCCIADIRNKVIACLYCGADMRGDV